MMHELVLRNRSYRRFCQEQVMTEEQLRALVNMARCTASAANRQPVRYKLVTDPDDCARVFDTLGWAGYLPDWSGPVEGERPAAYIILLGRPGLNSAWDEGIIAQTILLSAVEQGYGGCMLGNIRKPELAEALNIPSSCEIRLVIALGKPKEEVVIDEIEANGDIRYYRDDMQVHHVPKLRLDDLII